ncbi:MAG: 50S ribosomal protein L9 [Candidatus Aquicultorales bacterium]
MKVILSQQVKGVGKAGDVVNVSDGYAHNYLIPRGLAKPATTGALKDLDTQKAAADRREERGRAEARELADLLSSKVVTLVAKAGEKGHLYGSVTPKDVADAAADQIGVKLDKKRVEIPEPIKELGEYTVKVRLYPGTEANLTVSVKGA